LRRNPDTKWNRKPLDQKRRELQKDLAVLQAEVLENYASLVKPNGRLVYGVCTFNKRESVDAVASFLETHPEFVLQSQGYLGPYDTDGFFMASMTRRS
jgi:16S rRNA (cytosine967-C5)-methyltransferase